MNKAIKIFSAEARPYRFIIALVDQMFDAIAVYIEKPEDGLKPPASVNVFEDTDTETGVTTKKYHWWSIRLDVVQDRLFAPYTAAYAAWEKEDRPLEKNLRLNEMTRMQVRVIAFECKDDNGLYLSLSNGTRLEAWPAPDKLIKANLTKGGQGALKIAQFAHLTPEELAPCIAHNAKNINDPAVRGYFLVDPDAVPSVTADVEDVPAPALPVNA